MTIKPLISSLLITTSLLTFAPKKAEASVVIAAAIGVTAGAAFGSNAAFNLVVPMISVPLGGVGSIVGGIVAIFNPTAGIVVIVLGEDGSLTESDLQAHLAQKYDFIQDSAVTSELASMIISKAEGQTPVDGKIIVGLSEAEVMGAIAGTDLLETHADEVKAMVTELN